MKQWAIKEILHSRTVKACIAAFMVMVFSPWIYFIYPSAHPLIILLPFLLGLATAAVLLPKSLRGALTALAVATLLIIPTIIAGHFLAHETFNGCYD